MPSPLHCEKHSVDLIGHGNQFTCPKAHGKGGCGKVVYATKAQIAAHEKGEEKEDEEPVKDPASDPESDLESDE